MSREQSRTEERINALTHGFGALLGVGGWIYLIVKAIPHESISYLFAFSLFALSLITQFAISYFYHSAENPRIRRMLHVWDHAFIYILIAGSYTPFMLFALNGALRTALLTIIWATAAAGVLFKIKFTGRLNVISTLIYLAMGWIVITVIKPIAAGMSGFGLAWLVIGGVSYSVGALFYLCERMCFNHAVFHVFCLLGGFSHIIAAGSVA
jgi:hemolysin III